MSSFSGGDGEYLLSCGGGSSGAEGIQSDQWHQGAASPAGRDMPSPVSTRQGFADSEAYGTVGLAALAQACLRLSPGLSSIVEGPSSLCLKSKASRPRATNAVHLGIETLSRCSALWFPPLGRLAHPALFWQGLGRRGEGCNLGPAALA